MADRMNHFGWEIKMMSREISMKNVVCFFLVCLLLGCSGSDNGSTNTSGFETFDAINSEICTEDGKPVIRLFSTTWCPHCVWISDTFDTVVKRYVDEGLIVAHHWEVDTGDDTLTDQIEDGVPVSEMDIFDEFNPQGSIPTYVFGCKYYRIGNGYEQENDLASEAAEFEEVIEELLDEV